MRQSLMWFWNKEVLSTILAAQVVDMLQRDPTDKLHGMNVVYCAFGGEGGAGFLGLLASDQVYRFNGQSCQIVYVRRRRCQCPASSFSPPPTRSGKWICRLTT